MNWKHWFLYRNIPCVHYITLKLQMNVVMFFFQLQNIMDSQYLTYIAVTNWFKLFVPCDFFVPHPQHILRCRCVQKVLPNIHCILLLTVYINGRNFFDIQYANSDARPFTPDCFSFFNTVKDCFSLG